jgi:hypothetical protein
MASVARKPIAHGEISGSASAKQLPDVTVGTVALLKATISNAGNVYLGTSASVTVADGTQDATTGYELDAGDKIEVSVDNLNDLYIICDNAGDDLTYVVFGG